MPRETLLARTFVELVDTLVDSCGHHRHRPALAVSETQRVTEPLNSALVSRIVIEQAKGMVAERNDLNMEQAFARLRKHALDQNLRLVDVAHLVIDGATTRETFDPPRRARRSCACGLVANQPDGRTAISSISWSWPCGGRPSLASPPPGTIR